MRWLTDPPLKAQAFIWLFREGHRCHRLTLIPLQYIHGRIPGHISITFVKREMNRLNVDTLRALGSFLDYDSLEVLSRTNRMVHSVLSEIIVRRRTAAAELLSLAWKGTNAR
jgi:hypothetical protein